MKQNRQIWRLCKVSIAIIVIATFSPLVTAPGKIHPFLFGLPYTLWVGILLTIALVIITLIAGNILPNDEEDAK